MDHPPSPEAASDASPRQVATGLAKLALVLRQRAWQEGGAAGLTPTQGQILAFLRGSAPASLREVARTLGVRAATASEAVGALERKGLVSRTRHPDDSRRLALALTPAGRERAAQTTLWPDLLASVTAELPEAERAALLRALQRMIRSLQLRGEIPPARMCSTCRYFRPYAHPGEPRPHHCAFADVAFADEALRVDCLEHEPAPAAEAALAWQRFAAGG